MFFMTATDVFANSITSYEDVGKVQSKISDAQMTINEAVLFGSSDSFKATRAAANIISDVQFENGAGRTTQFVFDRNESLVARIILNSDAVRPVKYTFGYAIARPDGSTIPANGNYIYVQYQEDYNVCVYNYSILDDSIPDGSTFRVYCAAVDDSGQYERLYYNFKVTSSRPEAITVESMPPQELPSSITDNSYIEYSLPDAFASDVSIDVDVSSYDPENIIDLGFSIFPAKLTYLLPTVLVLLFIGWVVHK